MTGDAPLNVLVCQENDAWMALALERSLRGCGPTYQEALQDLIDQVHLQINFSRGPKVLFTKPLTIKAWSARAVHTHRRIAQGSGWLEDRPGYPPA